MKKLLKFFGVLSLGVALVACRSLEEAESLEGVAASGLLVLVEIDFIFDVVIDGEVNAPDEEDGSIEYFCETDDKEQVTIDIFVPERYTTLDAPSDGSNSSNGNVGNVSVSSDDGSSYGGNTISHPSTPPAPPIFDSTSRPVDILDQGYIMRHLIEHGEGLGMTHDTSINSENHGSVLAAQSSNWGSSVTNQDMIDDVKFRLTLYSNSREVFNLEWVVLVNGNVNIILVR